ACTGRYVPIRRRSSTRVSVHFSHLAQICFLAGEREFHDVLKRTKISRRNTVFIQKRFPEWDIPLSMHDELSQIFHLPSFLGLQRPTVECIEQCELQAFLDAREHDHLYLKSRVK